MMSDVFLAWLGDVFMAQMVSVAHPLILVVLFVVAEQIVGPGSWLRFGVLTCKLPQVVVDQIAFLVLIN